MNNINDTFFDGYYKELWRSFIPEELTIREIDFIVPFFNLKPGSKVLDLMCGYGRHAIALAKKGINVTAVDNLPDYVNEIKSIAEREQLPLKAEQADVINYTTHDQFDLVLCMGNSLNFFKAEDTLRLLEHISTYLKSKAHLLIHSWSLSEIIIKNFKEKTWSTMGNYKLLVDSKFVFHPTRIETDSIIISPDGEQEVKKAVDYIFSINELEAMLKNAGLLLTAIDSIPGKKRFTIGEPRAYIIAAKT